MTDTEVENTLREIRERVRAEAPALAAPRTPATDATTAGLTDAPPSDARARLEANLPTLERAWDKLPPLTSYRSGLAARVELWVKRLVKRATHWFTWEQVNFNASTLAALRDTLAALAAHERSLAEFRADAEAKLAALETRLAARVEQGRAAASAEASKARAEVAEARAEVSQLRAALDGLRSEAASVRDEARERAAHAAEEQRVQFKQLSLEATETAVALDRARRAAEHRLDELARRLERVENSASENRESSTANRQ